MKKMIAAFVVLAFALTSCGGSSDKDSAAELKKSQERIAELEAAASETTAEETPPRRSCPTWCA